MGVAAGNFQLHRSLWPVAMAQGHGFVKETRGGRRAPLFLHQKITPFCFVFFFNYKLGKFTQKPFIKGRKPHIALFKTLVFTFSHP